eukprot:PhF_6_TR25309/c0_g1_i1/m.34941
MENLSLEALLGFQVSELPPASQEMWNEFSLSLRYHIILNSARHAQALCDALDTPKTSEVEGVFLQNAHELLMAAGYEPLTEDVMNSCKAPFSKQCVFDWSQVDNWCMPRFFESRGGEYVDGTKQIPPFANMFLIYTKGLGIQSKSVTSHLSSGSTASHTVRKPLSFLKRLRNPVVKEPIFLNFVLIYKDRTLGNQLKENNVPSTAKEHSQVMRIEKFECVPFCDIDECFPFRIYEPTLKSRVILALIITAILVCAIFSLTYNNYFVFCVALYYLGGTITTWNRSTKKARATHQNWLQSHRKFVGHSAISHLGDVSCSDVHKTALIVLFALWKAQRESTEVTLANLSEIINDLCLVPSNLSVRLPDIDIRNTVNKLIRMNVLHLNPANKELTIVTSPEDFIAKHPTKKYPVIESIEKAFSESGTKEIDMLRRRVDIRHQTIESLKKRIRDIKETLTKRGVRVESVTKFGNLEVKSREAKASLLVDWHEIVRSVLDADEQFLWDTFSKQDSKLLGRLFRDQMEAYIMQFDSTLEKDRERLEQYLAIISARDDSELSFMDLLTWWNEVKVNSSQKNIAPTIPLQMRITSKSVLYKDEGAPIADNVRECTDEEITNGICTMRALHYDVSAWKAKLKSDKLAKTWNDRYALATEYRFSDKLQEIRLLILFDVHSKGQAGVKDFDILFVLAEVELTHAMSVFAQSKVQNGLLSWHAFRS